MRAAKRPKPDLGICQATRPAAGELRCCMSRTRESARATYWSEQLPLMQTAEVAMQGSAKQRTPGPEQTGSGSVLESARQSQPVQ